MVGGGASGLNVARHMKLHMENYELQIYEKNADVGGTWFENRYRTLHIHHFIGSLTSNAVADTLAVLVISHRITTSIPGNLTRIGRICEYNCINVSGCLYLDLCYAMPAIPPIVRFSATSKALRPNTACMTISA